MSLINLNPTNKEEIKSFVDKLTNDVEYGSVNALELHVKLTAMEKAITDLKKNIRNSVMKVANNYEQSFDAFNSRIEKVETGTKYDYSQCGDTVYDDLLATYDKVASDIKEREAFLKTVKPGTTLIDDDGVISTIYPPVKSSTSFLKITLK